MSGVTPERRLAAAVVAQAFSDLFAIDSGESNSADLIAAQAIRFLTDRSGHAAQWRNRWCSYLDMDGDLLAAQVRKILDGDASPPSHFEKHLGVARNRWALVSRVPSPLTTTTRLPRIKPAPTHAPPPSQPAPTDTPPFSLEPHQIELTIPDDAFYISSTGHIRSSRSWRDGETSRFLGPLPSRHTKIGEAVWTITQAHRSGFNALGHLAPDSQTLVQILRDALPTCDVTWAKNGIRLPEHQPNAGLRLYLKQPPKAA